MSNIVVNVTNAGATNLVVSNGSTVNATVGNGGVVNVAMGTISPGNATVVSGTLAINSVETLTWPTPAYVTNKGTAYAAKLDIGIPAGPATNIVVGSTTTLPSSSKATVTSTLSSGTLTLNFGIPQGATGSSGDSVTLSDSSPLNLGTASAGTSTNVSRADHVHNVPIIAYGNLTGVPSNFPTNTTLVSGLSAGYSAITHGHNYVTSLNGLAGALNLTAGPNVTITATNSSTLTIDATSTGIGANDAVDGGFYTGEVLQSITFTTQPQSQNVALGSTLNWTAASNTPRAVFSFGSQMLGVNVTATQTNGEWSAVANLANYSNAAGSPASTVVVPNLYLNDNGVEASLATNGARSLVQLWQFGGLTETLRSDDSGTTWSRLTVPRPSKHIAAGPLGFVSDADGNPGLALQSTDGLAWNTRTMPFQTSFYWRFAVGGTAIVGVCGAQNNIARSTTGVSWSTVSIANSFATNVAFGGGRFVALGGDTGGGKSYTSTDGNNWTSGNLPSSGYDRIFYAGNRFVALSNANTTDAAISTDGTTWALQTLPNSSSWRTVAAAGGYYGVAAWPSSGNLFATAPDSASGSANLTVVAVASTGATVGYQWQRSTDVGTTWANVANGNTGALNVTNVTLNDNGTRYRVLATATGVPSAYSATALLTVN